MLEFMHIGLKTLLNYSSWKESNLEVLEGLEQLRFLEKDEEIGELFYKMCYCRQ